LVQSHHEQLLELSLEQRSFIDHVQASRNVFLTGLGGTGKLVPPLAVVESPLVSQFHA